MACKQYLEGWQTLCCLPLPESLSLSLSLSLSFQEMTLAPNQVCIATDQFDGQENEVNLTIQR